MGLAAHCCHFFILFKETSEWCCRWELVGYRRELDGCRVSAGAGRGRRQAVAGEWLGGLAMGEMDGGRVKIGTGAVGTRGWVGASRWARASGDDEMATDDADGDAAEHIWVSGFASLSLLAGGRRLLLAARVSTLAFSINSKP
ncbi:unnamed protein product [Linum trigynum]|uniref:Uncharacterized protein n=1 Tax=Linum trigynum TaxID=586398 RepID=A0AAV2DMR3_9ROSI